MSNEFSDKLPPNPDALIVPVNSALPVLTILPVIPIVPLPVILRVARLKLPPRLGLVS